MTVDLDGKMSKTNTYKKGQWVIFGTTTNSKGARGEMRVGIIESYSGGCYNVKYTGWWGGDLTDRMKEASLQPVTPEFARKWLDKSIFDI